MFILDTITPTNFKENIGKVLQEVVHSNSEIEITRDSKNGLNDGVIMISKRKWELLQEELYLQRKGTWAYVSDLMDRLQLTRQKN